MLENDRAGGRGVKNIPFFMNQRGFANITLLIIAVAVVVGIGVYFVLNRQTESPPSARLLRICPDAWYEDRMPMVIGPDYKPEKQLPREYFIVDGSRREITEFDLNWIIGNCAIEKQIVY